MSRSGYVDDWSPEMNLYRGTVERSLRGKRGQAFLRELRKYLEEMEVKRLVAGSFRERASGEFCTLGVVADRRDVDLEHLNRLVEEEGGWGIAEEAGRALGISRAMAAEIMYMNDEWAATAPRDRWVQMYEWTCRHLKEDPDRDILAAVRAEARKEHEAHRMKREDSSGGQS